MSAQYEAMPFNEGFVFRSDGWNPSPRYPRESVQQRLMGIVLTTRRVVLRSSTLRVVSQEHPNLEEVLLY